MDYDSINRLGNPVPGVTPNLDRLIDQSLLFEKAHVNASNCIPVRQSMMTGSLPVKDSIKIDNDYVMEKK